MGRGALRAGLALLLLRTLLAAVRALLRPGFVLFLENFALRQPLAVLNRSAVFFERRASAPRRRTPVPNRPGDGTVEFTGPGGATVTFVFTATDDCAPTPTVGCAPASGSLFTRGTTTVTRTATDDANNAAGCSFDVTIADTTPPVITCSGDMIAECTGLGGPRVDFTVTATDSCDSCVPVSCTPTSGATFPSETTETCCTATDDPGNTATCRFDVTVVDTTPPVITCPGNLVAECTGPNGAPPRAVGRFSAPFDQEARSNEVAVRPSSSASSTRGFLQKQREPLQPGSGVRARVDEPFVLDRSGHGVFGRVGIA